QGAEGDWVDCMLFPNNSVAGPGWCVSWAPKAG
ncbi:MAG: high-potential iron-sulfur protein, partial [Aquimonas sp.]